MEEYLADSLLKTGTEVVNTQQMIRPGYFLLIIKSNSKLNQLATQYTMNLMAYVILVVVVIFTLDQMHIIEVIIIQT
jgi:hypothetical protein